MIFVLYHQRILNHPNNEKMSVIIDLQILVLLPSFLHQIDIIHHLKMELNEAIFHYYLTINNNEKNESNEY